MFDLFRPARSQARQQIQGGTDVVADLDALIEQRVSFKLHGKVHEIKPISSKDFLIFTNNLSKLMELKDKNKIEAEELIEKYHGLISSLCDTIKIEDIESMTQPQVGALFQLLLDSVTGKAQATAQKLYVESEKKTLKTEPSQENKVNT